MKRAAERKGRGEGSARARPTPAVGLPRQADRAPGDLPFQRLFAPVDIASIAVFRICFGAILFLHVLKHLTEPLIEGFYVAPPLLFKFYGFEWVEPLPAPLLRLLFWGLAALALMIAAGLAYRAASVLFFLGYTYVFLLNEVAYQNHLYLIALLSFLMVLVPAGRAVSLDAWRRPRLRSSTAPAWALWILRFQVAVPYVYGGIAKLNRDWLLRAEPIGLWLREGTGGPLRLDLLKERWAAYALAWGGTLLDLAIVPLLLWRRTRLPAFVVGMLFHLTNSQLFKIGVFPWLMIALTLIFFPPDWPRRVRLIGPGRPAASAAPQRRPAAPPARRLLLVAVLAAYVGVQLLVPFRHLLYPGNVDWTEEGHQFSWRMKLRDKRGQLEFVAVEPARGRVYPLKDVEALLNDTQYHMMLHDPQMIRQFARLLSERLGQAGYGDVQVRAVTSISLNGRAPQPLVDPEVDLAARRETLGHADWIVPLEGRGSKKPPSTP